VHLHRVNGTKTKVLFLTSLVVAPPPALSVELMRDLKRSLHHGVLLRHRGT